MEQEITTSALAEITSEVAIYLTDKLARHASEEHTAVRTINAVALETGVREFCTAVPMLEGETTMDMVDWFVRWANEHSWKAYVN